MLSLPKTLLALLLVLPGGFLIAPALWLWQRRRARRARISRVA
jgi:hypothetical protein